MPAITYDAIGNPRNDGTWNYTWAYGRQLRSMYKGSFGTSGYTITLEEFEKNYKDAHK